MGRSAVWQRGSRPHGSPGTTVNSLTPGEVYFKAPGKACSF